ncbi:hypothetical protein HXX76_009194 [Chlamydomonas incerta]|uniref:Uncharacterized protein n=1 Tax=Chlamydomonas incerta TaxID=51695 RepID=A0A835T644_CHLIN|nr:hypothetical protein HXX76_009194 [Chlamydomonas incerta]|eukprot:KAG2432276.1 hypothetical protein HXX76_009194 [Chlamydomonas incerta]
MAELFKEYQTLKLIEGCSDSWPGHAFVAHWGRAEPWRSLTLPQRERLLCLAASSGHAASLDAALAHAGCALMPAVLTAAAAAGSLAACERLLHEGCSFSADALNAAAWGGHLPALKLLLTAFASGDKIRDAWLVAAAEGACAGGQCAVLAWLQQAHGYSLRRRDAVAAARGGQVAALEQVLLPLLPTLRLPELGGVSGDEPEPSARSARWRVLRAIVKGCPVAVLQRHYDSLWRLPRGDAPGDPGAAGGGGGGGGRDFGGRDDARDRALVKLLVAAASSPTLCWAAKVDFLRSAACWGPVVAGQVLRGERGTLKRIWAAAARRPDFLARLKHLHAAGVSLNAGEGAAQAAAQGAHADALAWLWDEARVPVQFSDRFIPFTPTDGACAAHVPVLEMLRQRGAGTMTTDRLMVAVWALQYASGRGEGPHRVPPPGLKGLEGLKAAEAVLWWVANVWDEGKQPQHDHYDFEHQSWLLLLSRMFSTAAALGAGLPLLRALRARGAAVDLGEVAAAGSEEALEWAAAERGGAVTAAARLSNKQAQAVFTAGNTAALAWLRGRGLLPPASDYLPAPQHADADTDPSRLWQLRLRAQLEADEERKDEDRKDEERKDKDEERKVEGRKRSVWAGFLARARAAADVAVREM